MRVEGSGGGKHCQTQNGENKRGRKKCEKRQSDTQIDMCKVHEHHSTLTVMTDE